MSDDRKLKILLFGKMDGKNSERLSTNGVQRRYCGVVR